MDLELNHTTARKPGPLNRSIFSAVNKPNLAGQKDPEKPLYMGSQLNQFVGQGYMSGGSGYVLSRFVFSCFV